VGDIITHDSDFARVPAVQVWQPTDILLLASAWRDRYLAASVYNLPGSGRPDDEQVKRTRAALQV
jgi:hypothetical protein